MSEYIEVDGLKVTPKMVRDIAKETNALSCELEKVGRKLADANRKIHKQMAVTAERDQLSAELEDTRGRLGKSVVELSIAKAELSQERERVKLLRGALKITSSRLTSMFTTIEEDALIHRALSAGEGGDTNDN